MYLLLIDGHQATILAEQYQTTLEISHNSSHCKPNRNRFLEYLFSSDTKKVVVHPRASNKRIVPIIKILIQTENLLCRRFEGCSFQGPIPLSLANLINLSDL